MVGKYIGCKGDEGTVDAAFETLRTEGLISNTLVLAALS
jgi:hypothetical protein